MLGETAKIATYLGLQFPFVVTLDTYRIVGALASQLSSCMISIVPIAAVTSLVEVIYSYGDVHRFLRFFLPLPFRSSRPNQFEQPKAHPPKDLRCTDKKAGAINEFQRMLGDNWCECQRWLTIAIIDYMYTDHE